MKSFILKIIELKEKHPLQLVLGVALLIRLVAAIWAKGYMMLDDHYLIVEAAGSWADGFDTNHWLPWTQGNNGPHFMSFFYVGLVWVFFEFLQLIGIDTPDTQMFFLRLAHGLFSVLTVYYGYKIAEKLGNKFSAFQVGMILALLAFFPNFGVKQLVEMVCIPPLMASYWFMIKDESGKLVKNYIIAGILAGLAVGIRYQVGVFYVGIGVVLFFNKKFKEVAILSVTAGVVFFMTQVSDIYLWNEPFTQLKAYIEHNTTQQNNYVSAPWYRYIFTVVGFLLPPVSFFLLFGFFRNWKKFSLFVLPTLLFLAFHSLYPNKQERFILPALPVIITIGVIGWNHWLSVSKFWINYYRLNRLAWIFFWLMNGLVLVVFSTAYTKRQFVEPLVILHQRGDAKSLIVENTNSDASYTMIPWYYLDDWEITHNNWVKNTDEKGLVNWINKNKEQKGNYILFVGEERLNERVSHVESKIGGLEFLQEIEPGSLDQILYFLNPHNKAESTYLYQLK